MFIRVCVGKIKVLFNCNVQAQSLHSYNHLTYLETKYHMHELRDEGTLVLTNCALLLLLRIFAGLSGPTSTPPTPPRSLRSWKFLLPTALRY